MFWTWRETYIFLGTVGAIFVIVPIPLYLTPFVAVGCGAIGVKFFRWMNHKDLLTNGRYWISHDSKHRFSSFPWSYVRRWLG